MKMLALAFVLEAWSTIALAQIIDRTPVSDIRALMIAAIESPAGVASGVLIGDIAQAITRRFKAVSPIYIDVTTERRYAQAGCSRLKVLLRQEGVMLPGASAPRKETVEMGINYCRDGLPPKSLL